MNKNYHVVRSICPRSAWPKRRNQWSSFSIFKLPFLKNQRLVFSHKSINQYFLACTKVVYNNMFNFCVRRIQKVIRPKRWKIQLRIKFLKKSHFLQKNWSVFPIEYSVFTWNKRFDNSCMDFILWIGNVTGRKSGNDNFSRKPYIGFFGIGVLTKNTGFFLWYCEHTFSHLFCMV